MVPHSPHDTCRAGAGKGVRGQGFTGGGASARAGPARWVGRAEMSGASTPLPPDALRWGEKGSTQLDACRQAGRARCLTEAPCAQHY